MATSGTVGNTVISFGQILDHAMRRCQLLPQLITNEIIDTVRRILWMQLNMLNGRGIALWSIETQLLGLTYGQSNLTTKVGNLELLNANLREIQRIDGIPTSSAGGSSGNLYDQDLTTVCTQGAPNGSMDITFTTQPSALTQVGIYPAATGTWSFNIQVNDGTFWKIVQTVTNASVVAGTLLWYDIDAAPAAFAVRVQATSGTTLSVGEIVCGANPSDIPLGDLARDSWTQLPNKQFTGRPTLFYYDRRITTPIMHLWPTPGSGYVQTFLVVAYVQRQLQDVGTMAQQIQVPDRWYLPIIADLARNCRPEIKEAQADPNELAAEAERLMTMAWNSENPGGTASFIPNIRGYTR